MNSAAGMRIDPPLDFRSNLKNSVLLRGSFSGRQALDVGDILRPRLGVSGLRESYGSGGSYRRSQAKIQQVF